MTEQAGDQYQINQIQDAGAVAVGRGARATIYQGLTVEEVAALVVELKRIDQPTVWDGRIPYLGLKAFRERDARFFFGREDLVDELLTHLDGTDFSNFISIAGPSGSGKSSVARAGLFYALKEGRLESSDTWLLGAMQPKDDPLNQLAAAVERMVKAPGAGDYLRNQGQEDASALFRQVETLLSDDPRQRCILLVDQFEELFTLVKDESDRVVFIDLLTTAASANESRIVMVLTLRSDFVSHCTRYPKLRQLMSRDLKLVGAMEPRDLARAITLPALEVGAEIDPALVSRIMLDMKGEPGALPLMSFALRNLFDAQKTKQGEALALTLRAYLDQGGIERALERHANHVFETLTEEQQVLARSIFSNLIEVGQDQVDTRRAATLEELIPVGATSSEVRAVVGVLAREDVRLITTSGVEDEEAWEVDGEASQVTVTLAHEKLIDAWPWLRQLVDENREIIALQNQIRADARAWNVDKDAGFLYRGGRLIQVEEKLEELQPSLDALSQRFVQASLDQRQQEIEKEEEQRQRELAAARALAEAQTRRVTIVRRALLGVGTLLVIAVIAAVFGFVQQNIAASEAEEAEAQATIAYYARSTAEAEATRADLNLATAVFAQNTADEARQRAEQNEQMAVEFAQQAEQGRRATLVQFLAATSTVVKERDQDSELAILLALEAARLNKAYEAGATWLVDKTLRSILLESPRYRETLINSATAGTVNSVVFAPHEPTLASTGFGSVNLWNLEDTAAEPIRLSSSGNNLTLAFSPDGQMLASGNSDGIIRLWNLRDLDSAPTELTNHDDFVWAVAFSPDGQTLAAANYDATIDLWDLENQESEPVVLGGHEDRVFTLAFSPDGEKLASGGAESSLRLWDLTNLETAPLVLEGHRWSVDSVAFSPDGQTLASSSRDGDIRLWNMANPNSESIALKAGAANSIAFTADGQTLIAGNENGTVNLWHLEDLGQDPEILSGHSDTVESVAISFDGSAIASGSSDGTIRIWNMNTTEAGSTTLSEHDSWVDSIAFSPDGQSLASGGMFKVLLWELQDDGGQPIVSKRYEDGRGPLALSPDGQLLAFTSSDDSGINRFIHIWDLENSEQEPVILTGHNNVIAALTFSSDSQTLASSSWDGTVRLWEMGNLEADPVVLTGHESWVKSVALSPDGQTAASGSMDGTMRIWNLNDLESEPIVLDGFADDVVSVAFSPDGQMLASGNLIYNADNTIQLWPVDDLSAEANTLFEGDQDAFIESIAFSPDGLGLASSNNQGIIHIWDLGAADEEPISLTGHKGVVSSLAFSPDGQTLASSGEDGTVRLWALTDRLAALGCQKVGRNLTWLEWQRYFPGEPYHQTCPDVPHLPQDTHITFLISEGEKLVLTGEIEEALATFEEALALGAYPVFSPHIKVQEIIAGKLGINLEEGEKLEEAITRFIEANDDNDYGEAAAEQWNTLCWFGSLFGYAAEVMTACERAVALAPEHGGIRDSRGLARALTGDHEGAIEDFKFFVQWVQGEDLSLHVEWREAWIAALTESKNPFDDKTIKELLLE